MGILQKSKYILLYFKVELESFIQIELCICFYVVLINTKRSQREQLYLTVGDMHVCEVSSGH